MYFPRLAAAGLLILFSTYAQAEVRTIQAGNVNGLIRAFEDANADPSEVMVVVIKGTGTFEFNDDYEDSGFALPPLQGARVAVLVEKADVTFFLNPSATKSGDDPNSPLSFITDHEFIVVLAFTVGFDIFGLSSESPQPAIKQSGSASGPVISTKKGGVALSGIQVEPSGINNGIESQDSRLVTDGVVVGGRGIVAEASSAGAAPNSSGMIDFLDEVNDAYAAAQGGSREKAFVAELDASVESLKELAGRATIAISNSYIRAQGTAVSARGPSSIYVEDSLIQVAPPWSNANIVVAVLSETASRKAMDAISSKAVPQGTIRIVNSVIEHSHAPSEAIKASRSRLELDGVTIWAEDAVELAFASMEAYRSILGMPGGEGSSSERRGNCDLDLLSLDGFTSLGYNISADDTCPLSHRTDRRNADPKITAPAGGDLLPGLANNSPAIDRGPSGLVGGNLPCGTTDLLGTARPQDGNGNGKAECDIGAIEVASRSSIDRRQSGAYYDIGRNGEGVFVEMLGPDTALVYLFSYRPNGDPFWALGVGTVVGNGVIIRKQDFVTTRGGIFGLDFNPADVEFIPFADVSINFPDCRNTVNKGSLAIAPNEAMGFGAVLSTTERLTFILDCRSRNALGPGYSGSFFDPTHNGEGIILQVINASTVLVQWFTYDDQGNQYWIQGVGTLNGDTVSVEEALAYRGPRYGPNFDTGDLMSVPWGMITIEFDGCDAAVVSYDSVVAGFGQGTLDMQRLTSLHGVDCP